MQVTTARRIAGARRGAALRRPAVLGAAALAGAGGLLGAGGLAGTAKGPPRVVGSVITYSFQTGLDQPLSREAVFPDGPGRLLVVGGYFGATRSAGTSVEVFDTATGHVEVEGALEAPLAESARVVLGGADLLLGGSTGSGIALGAGTASAGVEQVVEGPRTGYKVVTTRLGSLPQPRAGAGAAVLGNRAYLAGGYDGGTGVAAVLETRDGRHYAVAANLLEAVRYPAVAAYGNSILVVGGELVQSGVPEPVDVVQAVIP
ncbi:MAG TPA: hypothetical protein VMD59_11540, partial [Acidimicrobiales bacterium]|nr:hypothetical protein [Acidimicrobiales bacterium]